jgi:hypothetical protein
VIAFENAEGTVQQKEFAGVEIGQMTKLIATFLVRVKQLGITKRPK